jgi:AmmeMemoRadiSam system protein B
MEGTRRPAVAGTFYSDDEQSLRQQIEWCFTHPLGPGQVPRAAGERAGRLLGLISPHAGLVYSGPAAAWGYAALAEDGAPPLVVLVGPSHTGLGAPLGVGDARAWVTPLGEVRVARDAGRALVEADGAFALDSLSHQMEHSLEVQLPFLQYLFGESGEEVTILPICIRGTSPSAARSAQELGLGERAGALAALMRERGAAIIASTDLSHFESQETAKVKDQAALDAILAFDPERLLSVVDSQGISMCGVLPVALALMAARNLGASAPRLLHYHTSGDIAGGRDQVVGYASLTIGHGGSA